MTIETVGELIEELQRLPKEARIKIQTLNDARKTVGEIRKDAEPQSKITYVLR